MALSPARVAPPRSAARAILARPLAARLIGSLWTDALLATAFVLVAGAVRWPDLLIVPEFTTGGAGILMALDIADGRAFYLREISPYIGAPYIWLLALVYKLFGPSIEATMLVTWAIGALTIVPAYLLGREIGGRVVGSIAALLLATSPAHTVITSHVPLSHSVTPLISTTVLWLLAVAVRRAGVVSTDAAQADSADGAAMADRRYRLADGRKMASNGEPAISDSRQALAHGGKVLALAGLLAGLALQTHPTVAPLLAGAAGDAVLMRRGWLRTRWPAVALAMALLGYGSLLVYHVTSGFEIVQDIQAKESRYRDAGHDEGSDFLRQVYPGNLGQLLLSSTRLVSGTIEDREDAAEYLQDPWVLAPTLVVLAGLGLGLTRQMRGRTGWLVLAVAVDVFVSPAFNGKYRPLLDGRFLMPLLPILFVMMGLAVVWAARMIVRSPVGASGEGTRADRASTLVPTPGATSPALRLARAAAMAALIVGTMLLIVKPIDTLDELYESSLDDGYSNVDYLAILHLLAAGRGDGEVVLLDPLLNQVKTLGGGKASTNFSWLLAVSRIPSETPPDVVSSPALTGRLAILHRTTANRLDDTLTLAPLDGRRYNSKDSPSFRLYRIGGAAVARP